MLRTPAHTTFYVGYGFNNKSIKYTCGNDKCVIELLEDKQMSGKMRLEWTSLKIQN